MDFDLSPEHEAFRKVVRDFAESEIAPHAAQWDEDHTSRSTPCRRWASSACSGWCSPSEWGGGDGDFASLCIAIEEIGRVDQSMGITLSAGVGLGANPIFRFGTDEQKQRWLPDLVAGRALGAFGLTEPDGGSDAGATRTRARRDGDNWVIDGTKAFITNSGTPITSIITVTAQTDDGISTFVVEAGTPGLIDRAARTASSAGTPATRTAWSSTTASCPDAPPARRAGRRLPQLPLDPRRRPHRDLRAWRSDAHVRASRSAVAYAKERTGVRRADRPQPGRSRSPSPTSRWRSRTRPTSRTRQRG